MDILLYRDYLANNAEWLPQLVAKLSGIAAVNLFQQREALLAQLRYPSAEMGIVVLQISNREELCNFVDMSDLFARWRVVLILPDVSADLLSLGHRLHPRYLMKPGDPLDWLEAILTYMAHKTCREKQAEKDWILSCRSLNELHRARPVRVLADNAGMKGKTQ